MRLLARPATRADVIIAVVVIVATAILELRLLVHGSSATLGNVGAAALANLLPGLVAFIVLRSRRPSHRPAGQALRRSTAGLLALLLVIGTGARIWHDAIEHSTPTVDPVANQLSWDLRLVAHALDGPSQPGVPAVVDSWPLQEPVEVAGVDSFGTGLVLDARRPGARTTCRFDLVNSAMFERREPNAIRCSSDMSEPKGEVYARITRAHVATSGGARSVDPSAGSAWPQYRHDPSRSAKSDRLPEESGHASPAGLRIWETRLGGQIRSSPTIVGGVILIGTHGTGLLAALDRDSGRLLWRKWLPNWIHQDVVTDGAHAVVGFGDNLSMDDTRSDTPSGVAAYAIASGQRLWTAFESSSVMTSPVLVDKAAVYVTSGGVVVKRDIETGGLVSRAQLPGGAVMAPPVIRGDTIVATLERNVVCALRASTLGTLWCRTLSPVDKLVGHSAATLSDSLVLLSSVVWGPEHLRKSPTWAGVRESFAQFVRIWLAQPPPIEGQRLYALRLRDGATVWVGPMLPKTRPTEGHTSGTPTVSEGLGVVLLPIADRVLAFRLQDGRILWLRPAFASRGPVLVDSGRVYAIGRRGELRVWALASGDSLCANTIARHFDRAGPILAGSSLIVGTLEGTVLAIPRAVVDRCGKLDLDSKLPEVAAVSSK